ncbi:MAG TPA: IclR family transcriptional regulator [Solirubrobacteraceae bacterium]|nr:IclR family transcriptional regulator [Solirubrobacteraceae bacterium]
MEQDFHVTAPAQGTQSIDRAGEMLARLLDSDEPMSLRDLAEAADLPKSTASRLLTALERHGLVHQAGERGKLEPGPAIMRFAHRGGLERHLVELAQPALEAISKASHETVNLSVPTANGVDHLAQVEGRHFLGAGQWVGRRVDYHCTANGKVFLAFGVAELPPGRLARLTTHTVVSRAALEDELERVRSDGFATTVDELEAGLSAIAVPVRGPAGDVIAALSVSGPTLRLTHARVAELTPILVQEAQTLEERLGNHRPGERAA